MTRFPINPGIDATIAMNSWIPIWSPTSDKMCGDEKREFFDDWPDQEPTGFPLS